MDREGEHTLVVINSCKIPPEDNCIRILATGQTSDKYEGVLVWDKTEAIVF